MTDSSRAKNRGPPAGEEHSMSFGNVKLMTKCDSTVEQTCAGAVSRAHYIMLGWLGTILTAAARRHGTWQRGRRRLYDVTCGAALVCPAYDMHASAPGSRDREGGVAHAVEYRSRDAAMAEALRRLSPEHWQVLLECLYRRSSVAEAAARLGVSAGTVKSRTHDALHALRLTLEELEAASSAATQPTAG